MTSKGSLFYMALRIAIATSLAFLGSTPCLARSLFVKESVGAKELNLQAIKKFTHLANQEDKINYNRYLPTNFSRSDNEEMIVTKIMKHNLDNVLKMPTIRESKVGHAAKKLDNVVNTDVRIGGDDNDIQHRFNLRVQAASAVARMKYSGLINAQITYQMATKRVTVGLNKNLTRNTRIIVHRTMNSGTTYDRISFRYSW